MKGVYLTERKADPSIVARLFGVSVVVILGWVAGRGALDSKHFLLLTFITAVFAVLSLKNELWGLVIVLTMSYYYLHVKYLLSIPSIFDNLIYGFIVVLLLERIVTTILAGRPMIKTPMNNAIYVLFGFIIVSFALGGAPIGAASKALIRHASFILLFLVLVNSSVGEATLKKMIKGVIAIALLQAPASIFQYYVLNSGLPQGARIDQSAGLLGWSSGDVNAVFMTYVFSIVLGVMITKGLRVWYIMAIPVLLVSIILSSARAGLIFFVVTGVLFGATMVVVGYREKIKGIGKIGFVMVVVVASIIAFASEGQINFVTNLSRVYEYSMSSGRGLGRIQAFAFVHDNIGGSVRSAIVGFGPGSVTPTKEEYLGGTKSKLYSRHERGLLYEYQSYAYVTLELGYGGLLIYLFLHCRLFMLNRRFFQKVEDSFWKAISAGFFGIIATSAYSIFYTLSWVKPALVFSLWFLGGSIYRVGYLKGIFKDPRLQVKGI